MRPRIAFVSREVFPFGGGGLGASVTAFAKALAPVADVTVITTDLHEERYHELRAVGAAELPPVQFAFVEEPTARAVGLHYDQSHLWGARVFEKVKELYPDGGPDLVEVPDYGGEGAVLAQARRSRDGALRNGLVLVRNYTPIEMCDVLNGRLAYEPQRATVYELERYTLRYADRMLWPGGDVLGMYRRFYGEERLAPPELVRHVVEREVEGAGTDVPSLHRLQLIFIGRFERRKGVQNLVRAATGLDRDDWHLTLLGGDTSTGPLGVSLRAQLELMVAGDPRISFHPAVSRREMFDVLRKHHAAIYPSLWECWPFVALHAFDCNRPVIATPTGGFIEMVTDESGWLTRDTSASAVGDTLERILDAREQVADLIERGGPRDTLDRLADTEQLQEQYLELAGEARRARRLKRRRRASPLVSVVIPYFHLDRYLEATVEGVFEQTYSPLEVIVVNDGSFRREDMILAEIATRYPITVLTQQNSGLGAARNFGVSQSRGKYVFPLDADNVPTPTFVEQCVEALEDDPNLAYVNSWVRFIDEDGRPHPPPNDGYHSIANDLDALTELNVAGDAAAVIRRRVFDLGHWYSVDATSYEDWLFYRELRENGLIGHSLPEPLILYRIRPESMLRDVAIPHHDRLVDELAAHAREKELEWTSSSV